MPTRQPNSSNCFVCGVANPIGLHLKFFETNPGDVEAEVTLPAHYQGYPGIAHGGIIAAMLDEVAGRAHMGLEDRTRFMFTASLKVIYRKNVPLGQPLRLVGKAGATKGRVADAKSMIFNQEGVLLAEANAILIDVPDETFANVDLNALGWRVYSDEEIESSPACSNFETSTL